MQSVGGLNGIGAPISNNQIGGENFIRHVGSDKLIFDFHEGSGTTVYDKSHCGNNGTFGAGAAAPTWRRNSLYFDGGDYINLAGINHGITTGGFTFCFFLSSFTGTTAILSQQLNIMYIYTASNTIQLVETVVSNNIATILQLSFQIVRDNKGNLECYVNGKSQDKGTSLTTNFSKSGTPVITLGCHFNYSLFITSTMYSFRILNKGLSRIECQQEYLANKFRGNN